MVRDPEYIAYEQLCEEIAIKFPKAYALCGEELCRFIDARTKGAYRAGYAEGLQDGLNG